jgi:DNA-directed RNA polymerase subunit RPC12/RpoP
MTPLSASTLSLDLERICSLNVLMKPGNRNSQPLVPSGLRFSGAKVLGDVLVERLYLRAACRACSHRASLSSVELAQRLGYDFPLPDLKGRLRCSKCGKRQVDVTAVEPAR